MKFVWSTVAGAAIAAQGMPALAQVQQGPAAYYSCRDANGRMLTADRLIVECMDRQQKEHNADGSVRRIIEPQPTAEQRKAREAEERRKQEERVAQEEQRRRDRALLSSYSTTDSLDAAHKRALAAPESLIDKSNERLADLAKERKALEGEREFYKGRPLPAEVERKLQDNLKTQQQERDTLARREDDLRKLKQRQAEERARFIELTKPANAK